MGHNVVMKWVILGPEIFKMYGRTVRAVKAAKESKPSVSNSV